MFYIVLCHFIFRHFVILLSLDVVFFDPLAVYVLMDVALVLNNFNSVEVSLTGPNEHIMQNGI